MNLLNIITPTNLKEEKDKFLNSKNYQPVFSYRWDKLKADELNNSPKHTLIKSILNQNHDEIIKNAKIYFEINEFEYLELAEKIVQEKPETSNKQTQEDYVKAFENAFKFFGLNEYKVKVSDLHGFNFRPSVKTKEIIMSKHANFQFFDAEGEAAHELVHIIRYENGKFNKIKRSSNYLSTEEGLATYIQDSSVNGKASLFQHAAEYVASYIGLNGSLRAIYDFFIKIGFSKELAWQRASRHKFGFVDTSVNGDILKPAMYFANSQKISKLTSEQILRLFIGKISLDDVDKYEKYTGKFEEEKIIEFFRL